MLPDWPTVKAQVNAWLLQHMKQETFRQAPILARVSRITMHEGHGWSHEEQQGPGHSQGLHESSAEVSLTREELRGDFAAVVRKYSEMGASFAEQQSRHMIAVITRVSEESGNVIRGQGALTQDEFLALSERVQTDLDPVTKEPKNALFLMHPDLARKVIPEVESWERDPVFRARLAELRERQWLAFRDRESNRRLVD